MSKISPRITQAINEIELLIGGRLSTNAAVLELHGHDESWHTAMPPDAVCFAQSIDEVSGIVAVCHKLEIPVIPFGTATGMEGQVVEAGSPPPDMT